MGFSFPGDQGETGRRWAAPGHGRCRAGCPEPAAVPWDRLARAAAAGDARSCAAPGPAGRRPGTAGPVRPALPGGPEAPRSHSGTSGVGDASSRRQLGFRPRPVPRASRILGNARPLPSSGSPSSPELGPPARRLSPLPSPLSPSPRQGFFLPTKWDGAGGPAWREGVSLHPPPRR